MALRPIVMISISAAAMLAAAGSASAATISFASDDDSSFPTVIGTTGAPNAFTIRNGRTPVFTPVTLRVDDDNMSQPTFSVAAGLLLDLTATHAGSTGSGSAMTHFYSLTGTFTFVRASDGVPLVTAQVNGGSMLALGGNMDSWNSAGTMFGSDGAAGDPMGVNYQTSGLSAHMQGASVNPSLYGLSNAYIDEDFSFSLTFLNSDGERVALDPQTRLPMSSWEAEASFSGHMIEIPSPTVAGGLALAGMGLMGRRRRRS
jgi:hypothetical protein